VWGTTAAAKLWSVCITTNQRLKKYLEDNRQEGMKLQETLKNQALAWLVVYLNTGGGAPLCWAVCSNRPKPLNA
jgi:hypothetical protein